MKLKLLNVFKFIVRLFSIELLTERFSKFFNATKEYLNKSLPFYSNKTAASLRNKANNFSNLIWKPYGLYNKCRLFITCTHPTQNNKHCKWVCVCVQQLNRNRQTTEWMVKNSIEFGISKRCFNTTLNS